MSNPFAGPMEPWPPFASYVRRLELSSSRQSLFLYDTGVPAGASPSSSPMLLIHGLGDEADTWRHLLPALATNRRVIALDLPGFGRSDKPSRQYTVNFYQSVTLELLDELTIERAIVVGHSLGAIIAQNVALTHADRVAGLILIGGALVTERPPFNLGMALFMIPGVGEGLYNRLRKDPDAAYATLRPFYADLDALPAGERDFLHRRVNERVWDDNQRRAFFSILRHLNRWIPRQQRSLPDRLARCSVPTMIIWGAHDQVNSVGNGEKLAGLLPDADLVVIPDAGHNVQQEQPGAVLDAITGLLRGRPH